MKRGDREVELSRHEAEACPFCGTQPTIQFWHGGGPRKRMVSCDLPTCTVNPSVVGSTRQRALDHWNTRDGKVLR